MLDLITAANDYERNGWVLIPSAVTASVALDWADRARAAVHDPTLGTILNKATSAARNMNEGGAYRHGVVDSLQVRQVIPELFGWYEAARLLLESVVRRPVITSPYERSQITLKVYEEGGEHGWHRDTNPLTALLLLTETEGDYGTEVEGRDGAVFNVRNQPGDLWVMAGRELRHKVPPVPAGLWRCTVPLNYYHPDDTWRPDGMDDLVYSGEQ